MSAKPVHILLAEDEADHAELIRRAFASSAMGAEVTAAASLAEARARLAEATPDLLIADLLLPDGKGTELIGPAEGPGALPVVVMTAYGDEAAAVEAMRAGALDYVVKSEATLADMPHIAERALREWDYLAERREMVAQLLNHRQRLRALASELVVAEQRERRRIALGLHDSVAQDLSLAILRLQELRECLAGGPEADRVNGLIDLIDGSLREVGALTFELSPAVLFTLGLQPAAEQLAERMTQEHGLAVTCRCEGVETDLSEDLRAMLYRALKELLTNVVKHARAGSAEVLIEQADGRVRLRVSDDGAGFDPSEAPPPGGGAGGFGLFSIRERIEHIGGQMRIDSRLGQGTIVTLSVPHEADAEAARPVRGS